MLDFKEIAETTILVENCNQLEIHPETENGLTLAAMPKKCFKSFAKRGLQLGACGAHTHYVHLGKVIEEVESGMCLSIKKREDFYKDNFYASEPIYLDYCDKKNAIEIDFETGRLYPRDFDSEKCVYVDSTGFLRLRNCIEHVSGNFDVSLESDMNAFDGHGQVKELEHADLEGYDNHAVSVDYDESLSDIQIENPVDDEIENKVKDYNSEKTDKSSNESPKPPAKAQSAKPVTSKHKNKNGQKLKPHGRPQKYKNSKKSKSKSGRRKWGSLTESRSPAGTPLGEVTSYKQTENTFEPKPKPHRREYMRQLLVAAKKQPKNHRNRGKHSQNSHKTNTIVNLSDYLQTHQPKSQKPKPVIDLSSSFHSYKQKVPKIASPKSYRPPSSSYETQILKPETDDDDIDFWINLDTSKTEMLGF